MEGQKNEDMMIPDDGTFEVEAIHQQSIIVGDHEKDVGKEQVDDNREKSTTIQEIPEDNIQVSSALHSFSVPSMVDSDLSSSTCPIEPMDQSTQGLQRLAMAPMPNGSPNSEQSECNEINQAWFTTKEDKDSLQGKGVKWRQGMWSKEESELLQNNILQYCKNRGISDPHKVVFKQSKEERKTFYRTIAKGIHRPLFAIYRRVLRMYETGNYNGKYTQDEVARLRELRIKHGNDWTAIGVELGRSASSVKDRCRLLNDKCSSGKWSQDEETRLSQAVHELTSTVPGESVTVGILWTDVARKVGTRSEKQCRSKWLNYLNWKECGGKEWNKTDEIDLIKKIYNSGVQNESEINWSSIADGWSSVRSPQWLRSKWWTIKKHVPQCLSFSDMISYLHSHYAQSLKHRLNRPNTCTPPCIQLPTAEQPMADALNTTDASLSPLTTCATVSTSVGHAITVDGEIYIARGDGKGSDGINTYEMVHLRPLPNNDPGQPTSYIIEPVQCTVTGSATSYILHQTSQGQGAKLVKVSPIAHTAQQGTQTDDHEGAQPSNNTQDSNIIAQPVMVSTLPSNVNAVVVSAESLPKHVQAATEIISLSHEDALSAGLTKAYVEKGHTDILQQDQQLDCVSEEEISTSAHEESTASKEVQDTAEHNNHDHEQSHDAIAYDHRSPKKVPSPTVTQSLDMNFTTTDNTIYSHSLVPSLVSNNHPARIITNEVIIAQPILPENILQTQGDEPAFLTDSTIVVSSPLEIVHGSLAEVTVADGVGGMPSDSLIMEGEMTYFK